MGGGGVVQIPKKISSRVGKKIEQNCNERKTKSSRLPSHITLVMHMYFAIVEMTEISAGNSFLLFPVH